MRIDYTKKTTPPEYVCGDCGATGCKLWREYQTVAPRLLCADCAYKDQCKSHNPGELTPYTDLGSDQIGLYVPAVPDEEGVGYWGYTSVPKAGCHWWYGLPTRPRVAA